MVNSLLFLILNVHLLFGTTTSTPAIGAGRSPGSFSVDGSNVRGNSTITEGSTIETSAARVVIRLHSAEVTVLPQSRIRVFRDHSVLQAGAMLLKDEGSYLVDAADLRINTRGRSFVQVRMTGPAQLVVGAPRGMAEVRTASGSQVATVYTGTALNLTPGVTDGESTMSLIGCVERQGDRFLVTDETSRVTVELQGPEVAGYVGRRVAITGTRLVGAPGLAGVAHTVQVVTAEADGSRACNASGAAVVPPKVAGGRRIITPGRAAVIAGVAVSAAILAAAAAGSLSCDCPLSPQ